MATSNKKNAKPNQTDKLEEIESELNCSICHDYFVNAHTLTCSHSFCFNCIENCKKYRNDCPICRQKITSMAPSRALDNMVAALNKNDKENTKRGSNNKPESNSSQIPQQTANVNDDPNESDSWYDEEEEGSYYGEEEEYYEEAEAEYYEEGEHEGEEEEEEEEEYEGEEECEWEEDEENEGGSSWDDEEDEDDYEEEDDDSYYDHVKRSNQNNPNNDEYWKLRGWSGRPDNWKELYYNQ